MPSWPDGFLDRVLALRRNRAEIDFVARQRFPDPGDAGAAGSTSQDAMVLNSTLVARQATWEDDDLLVDLCADAPEMVGDWTVTVERGPNPYAQFRLAGTPERDRARGPAGRPRHGRPLRCGTALIGGERTSVHHMSGWRVRNGFRGMGLSRMLQFRRPVPGCQLVRPGHLLLRANRQPGCRVDLEDPVR